MNRSFLTRAFATAALAALVAPLQVSAQKTKSGVGPNGMAWQATSRIVGVTSTGTTASGGDATYQAPSGPGQTYSGVVTLIMNYGAAGSFICSGTLLPDRQSILTAGHCVSDGFGTAGPISTTVFFPETDPDGIPSSSATAVSRTVTTYFINPLYTGDVIDQNDIAVLRMNAPAPAGANSYSLFGGADLTGSNFNVAGYGQRSNVGGNSGTGAGAALGTGRLRQGDNRYEYRLGDSDFGGAWAGILGEPAAQIAFSYVSDFDNGLAANDTGCRVSAAINAALTSAKFCNLGRGAREVSVAGGDSGGPQFIGGQIASVTSYGLSFGTAFGDILTGLNSSFGEYNGFVPVFIHTAFINASLVPAAGVVPEPATFGLMAAGLMVLGVASRRRRNV